MFSREQRPMFRFLVVQTVASVVGLQAWLILFNNFAVEVVGLNGRQVGIVQSVREIPGFLALLAVFVLLLLREHRLSSLSLVLLGLGTGLAGFFPSFTGVLCTTLVMSFGFHYFETTNQSLTLQYFDAATSPLVFGRLRSLAGAAAFGTGLLLLGLGRFLNYRGLFLAAGLPVVLAGLWGLLQDPTRHDMPPQQRRMVFRRRYSLYYFLTFMAGARRQIFVAFSVFLLVKVYGLSVASVTLLFIINNGLNYFLSPLLGRAIVRYGERRLLSLEYGALVFIFLAYAFSGSRTVVLVMYVLDQLLFNFAFAIRTYFQKVAAPEDIAPSMAAGFTINHIAAVVMPLVGGALWMIDYRIPFVAGALLSLVSLVAVQRIPGRGQRPARGQSRIGNFSS